MAHGTSLRFLAVARTPEMRERLGQAAQAYNGTKLETRLGSLRLHGESLPLAPTLPDLLLVDLDVEDPEELAALDRLRRATEAAAMPILVTGPGILPSMMRRLLRDGVADVIPQPCEAEELTEALRTAHLRLLARRASATTASGRLLTFTRASGGVGATTLAVNAAVALRQPRAARSAMFQRRSSAGKVCLVDLDLQFGAAGIQLDLPASTGLIDLVKHPDRLDREMLLAMLAEHEPSGLRVLTAPKTPIPLEAVGPELVQEMLRLLRAEFDHVVVDLPPALTRWTEAVLSASSDILLVTRLNVPALRQLRRLLDSLQEEGLYALPYRLVVNRHEGGWPGWSKGVSRGQAERALGRKIDFLIGNDERTALDCANQGLPAMQLKRRSRLVRDVAAMLDALSRRAASPSPVAAAAA